jgi:Ca-activated chloride channel family protein
MWLARPAALFLVLLPLAVFALRHWLRRRWWGHPGGVVWSQPHMDASPWRHLPDAFMLLAMVALAVALADPHTRRTVSSADVEGTSIVIVVDLSASTQERVGPLPAGQRDPPPPELDPRPTRLEVLKEAMKDFVSMRRSDRVGLVAFSETAYVISPLTTDHEYLYHYIDLIDARTLTGEIYTAIGEGVAAASMLLDFQGVRDGQQGVVLVFTDGESNVGRDPVAAVRALHEAGHRGYMIGVDLPEFVTSTEHVRALVDAFVATGGRYFDAESGTELERAYQVVSALENASLELETRVEDRPIYHLPVGACILFLMASLALRAVPFFVDLS